MTMSRLENPENGQSLESHLSTHRDGQGLCWLGGTYQCVFLVTKSYLDVLHPGVVKREFFITRRETPINLSEGVPEPRYNA